MVKQSLIIVGECFENIHMNQCYVRKESGGVYEF